MITTGIHIPDAVLKKLGAAVAGVHRETIGMTMDEFRKAYREKPGATLGCYIHVEFTAKGAVKSFDACPTDGSRKKFREHGFQADVPMLGPARYAAKPIADNCAEFLLRREIARRRKAGQRELVGLTDDELSAAAEELSPLENWLAVRANSCGSLSEQLRMRLIEDEVQTRSNESNHQRLEAQSHNADYLTACAKIVEAQHTAAREWREAKEATRYYNFFVHRDFDNRSEPDQTLIAYRDAQGWQV